MNARISSAQLGSAGEALSALADSIKQRAFESKESSDLLVNILDSMNELASRSSEQIREAASERETQDACLADMRAAVADLQLSQEASAKQIKPILDRADSLHKDIGTTRAGFMVTDRFNGAVNLTQEKIKTILTELQLLAGESNYQGAMLSLAEFAGHYTMNAERDVHDSTGQKLNNGCSTSEAAEVDDSVEFF
jgi:hypothetical protein